MAYDYGQGLWCGVIFCVCGLLGTACGKSPTMLKIKLFLYGNITAISFALILAAIAICNVYKLRSSLSTTKLEGHPYSSYSKKDSQIRTLLTLFVVQIVISIIIISLTSFSLMSVIVAFWIRSKIAYHKSKENVVWV